MNTEERKAAQMALDSFDQSKPMLPAITALRAALAAPQGEPVVTEDMKMAVRWAPSSAYWSGVLVDIFGPNARDGIYALEKQLREARDAAPQPPVAKEPK